VNAAQREHLAALYAHIVKAGNDRLDGVITREQHADIVRQTIVDLDQHGVTWEQLVAFDAWATA
jgi:hypothetical protein